MKANEEHNKQTTIADKQKENHLKTPTVLGSNEKKVKKFLLWDKAFARNNKILIALPFLVLITLSVVIYAFAATTPWSSINLWNTWNYETSTTSSITHANQSNLSVKYNANTFGYKSGNFAQYRINIPSDVTAKSINFRTTYYSNSKVRAYLAGDSMSNKLWSKINKHGSNQYYNINLNGQHTLYFGIEILPGMTGGTFRQSQYLTINSYTLKGDQITASDTVPPNVAIINPVTGASVTGVINLSATASDNVGVANVLYRLDGQDIGSPITSAPYMLAWDSNSVIAGNHTLTAVAKDTSGNTVSSVPVTFYVANPTLPSQTILWQSGMENGTLSDWYAPVTSSTTVNGMWPGGGEFDSGTGYGVASQEQAHSGTWSLKSVLPDGVGANRMFRWLEPRENRGAYYSTWLYIPQAYTLTAPSATGQYINIMQFKSQTTTGENAPVWAFLGEMNSDGKLYIYPTWGYGGTTVAGPLPTDNVSGKTFAGFPTPLPVGKWVHLEAYMYQSSAFDGVVKFWQDDQLMYSVSGVRTGYNNCNQNSWCVDTQWSINEYSDGMSPFPSVMYFDDAKIWK